MYCYKPTMDTCCPAYTIRLDADHFTLSKGQKKCIGKMRKYVHQKTEIQRNPDTPIKGDIERIILGSSDLSNLLREAEGLEGDAVTHSMRVFFMKVNQ